MDEDVKPVIKMEVEEKPLVSQSGADNKSALVKINADLLAGKHPHTVPGKVLYPSDILTKPPKVPNMETGEWSDTDSEGDDGETPKKPLYYRTPSPDDYGGYEDNYEDYWPHNPLKPEILNKFETALGSSDNFDHTFAHQSVYEDAPNPVMRIEGFGYLGLPLSDAIIPALFPHCGSMKTEADEKASQPMKIGLSKIHFENPAWTSFLENAVENAYLCLGATSTRGAQSSQPVAILKGAFIYGPNSRGFANDSSDNPPRTFGTLTVILPTTCPSQPFTASHDQRSISFEPSRNPTRSTVTISAYNGVEITTESHRSGYELVLSFALVDINERPVPSLTAPCLAHDILEEAFSRWREDLPDATTKILWGLEHKYARDDLTLRTLKGEDYRRASLLGCVASRHGFRVGLAFVERFVLERAGFCGDADPLAKGTFWRYTEGAPDLDVAEKWTTEKTRIRNLTDVRGSSVAKTLFYNEKEHIWKVASQKKNRRGQEVPNATAFSPEDDMISRWFRQAVIVIWPTDCEIEFHYGTSYLKHALDALKGSTSEQPSQEELQFVRYLLRLNGERLPSGGRVLFQSIFRWKHLDLWRDAVSLCPRQQLPENCAIAVSHFGLETLLPSIRTLMAGFRDNTERLTLLDALAKKIAEYPGVPTNWVSTERDRVLRSLLPINGRYWRQPSPFPPLIRAAALQGGITYFRDVILPQIQASLTPADLVQLVNLVHGNQTLIKGPEDETVSRNVVTQLKSQLILSPTPESIPAIMGLIKLSCDPEKDSSWREDLTRLVAPPTATTEQGTAFLRELLASLQTFVSTPSFDKSNPPFRPFFKRFVKTYVDTFLGPVFSQLEQELIGGILDLPCDCDWCRSIVAFLETPTQDVLTLQKISKNQIKHAQKYLGDQNGEKLLSWEPVLGLPQFKIIKNEDSRRLIHWPTYRQRVITFLVALTDNDNTLKDVMGDAEYRTLLRNLDAETIHPQPEPLTEEISQEERPSKRRRIRTPAKDVIDLVSP